MSLNVPFVPAPACASPERPPPHREHPPAHRRRRRLNALLHNFLTMLKTEALPAGYARLAPKAMRFRLFNLPGALVRHARRLVLTIAAPSAAVEVIIAARQALAALAEILRPRPRPR